MTTIENIYNRYDYLCGYYASKIIIPSNSPYEKDDIIQELRMRLFMSIQTYSVKYSKFLETGSGKPIPLQFYVKTVLINRTKDLMKEVNTSNLNLSIQSSGLNFGTDKKEFSYENYNLVIDGENILDLFSGDERVIMKLLLIKNFDQKEVVKKFKNKIEIKETIEKGLEKIKEFLNKRNENVNEFYYFQLEN